MKLWVLPFVFTALIGWLTLPAGANDVKSDAKMDAVIESLPAGVDVLPPGDCDAFKLRLGEGYGHIEVVELKGEPFDRAVRVVTTQEPRRRFGVQFVAPGRIALKKGQVVLLTFVARTVATVDESGEGKLEAYVRQTGEPFGISGKWASSLPVEWTRFYLPCAISASADPIEPGQVQSVFNAGFVPQTVEIADVRWVAYDSTVKMGVFPKREATYPGREPDAAWRAAAAERIARNRMGDLTVRVVDGAGAPVADARIQVKMTRHAFVWGSAFNAQWFEDHLATPDGKRYGRQYAQTFNGGAHIGILKWPWWNKSRQTAIDNVDWMVAHGLSVRGHNLIWARWDRTPFDKKTDIIKKYENDLPAMRKLLIDHIKDEAGALRGKITEWDVINEPWSHYHFMEVLGNDVIVDWFNAAHEADPDARLVINENNILTQKGLSRNAKNVTEMVQLLQKNNAPITGVGFESHFGWNTPGPEVVWENLDHFAKMDLDLSITEFDQVVDDLKLQADWERDFLTIAFSHPRVVRISRWGFWNGISQRGFLNKDWTLMPNGKVYMDLVFNQWWTNLDGVTDAQGNFQGRGFLGDYDIIIKHGGQEWTFAGAVGKEGATMQFALTDAARQAEQARREAARLKREQAIAEVEQRMAKTAAGVVQRTEVDPKYRRARIDIDGVDGLTLAVVSTSDNAAANAPNPSGIIVEAPVDAQTWQAISVTVKPSADGQVRLNLRGKYVKGSNGDDRTEVWVYFDDVRVKGAASELANGDFEEIEGKSAPAKWTMKKGLLAKVIRTDGLARSGSACVEVWHGASVSQTLDVKKDSELTISGWVRLAQ